MSLPADVEQVLAAHSHVAAARSMADARISEARAHLEQYRVDGLDIVGFGSLARREMTAESDFDYLVMSTTMPTDPAAAQSLLIEADGLRHVWATEAGQTLEKDKPVAAPGTSGVFGRAVGAFDLVHQIGLQEDTNHSLTRRMLLLEESVSLLNPPIHQAVVEATLRRYLELGTQDLTKVPRFLLNDVTRYWHTITVDYQAKARGDSAESGLRYLKLIIPRKVLFAGTVMSLLLCGLEGWHRANADDLREQFALTPLERLVQGLAQASDHVRMAMEGVVGVIDHYLEMSAQSEWRDTVKKAQRHGSCDEFEEMRDQATALQQHLEVIFFDWDLIRDRSRRNLVF